MTTPSVLVRRLRPCGSSSTMVLETALNEELTEHLGHDKHGASETGNVRNGTRTKTVLTEATGHVDIEMPRDRAGTFEPQIVRKRQRRLSGVAISDDTGRESRRAPGRGPPPTRSTTQRGRFGA